MPAKAPATNPVMSFAIDRCEICDHILTEDNTSGDEPERKKRRSREEPMAFAGKAPGTTLCDGCADICRRQH